MLLLLIYKTRYNNNIVCAECRTYPCSKCQKNENLDMIKFGDY